MEGFTEIEYVKVEETGPRAMAAGRVDMSMWDVPGTIPVLDEGQPIVVLAGVHAGCYELIAHRSINSIRDLKGKRIGVQTLGGGDHVLLSSMLAYVGIDPTKDVAWVPASVQTGPQALFVDGKVDAILGFAPVPQVLRWKGIGQVIVNTTTDRPWSQYFCCTISANREFTQRYPIATKRALRAILKAADICAREPERAAQLLVRKGFEPDYEIGLEVLKSLPYSRWRESNPEDTLRFHALRLHEVGMINSTPQKLIAQGTDWRFLNELKKELKA
jgi:NitT/TauT family transport system substrate-binding protein